MKPKIVGLIQARIGSKRFPRKILENLAGPRIIEWVLHRTARAELLDQVVLVTPSSAENDILSEIAGQFSIPTLRGSEDDVLSRFIRAADQFGADHVVRICADNPFIASEEIDRLIRFYLQRLPDYAFNHIPRMENLYPDGLGAEILSSALLRRIAAATTEPRHREHVTIYLWDHRDNFHIETFHAPAEIAFP